MTMQEMGSTTSAVMVTDINVSTINRKCADGLIKNWWFVIHGDKEEIEHLEKE